MQGEQLIEPSIFYLNLNVDLRAYLHGQTISMNKLGSALTIVTLLCTLQKLCTYYLSNFCNAFIGDPNLGVYL